MGMFDYYLPEPALRCPVCESELSEWQGKDGPCGLFVWRQGTAAPVDHSVDPECRLADDELAQVRLPDVFSIYAACCGGRFFVEALCETTNGAWTNAQLVTGERVQMYSSRDEPSVST